jgi:myo-inositol 2-dehydrogenase/D-chiro-inositol 1-dehydrogenase
MIAIRNNTADTHVLSNADGIHSELPLYFFLERYMDAYITEMGDFVDCVLNDKLSPVGGMAAWKSYRENRPVKVSELEFEV